MPYHTRLDVNLILHSPWSFCVNAYICLRKANFRGAQNVGKKTFGSGLFHAWLMKGHIWSRIAATTKSLHAAAGDFNEKTRQQIKGIFSAEQQKEGDKARVHTANENAFWDHATAFSSSFRGTFSRIPCCRTLHKVKYSTTKFIFERYCSTYNDCDFTKATANETLVWRTI